MYMYLLFQTDLDQNDHLSVCSIPAVERVQVCSESGSGARLAAGYQKVVTAVKAENESS